MLYTAADEIAAVKSDLIKAVLSCDSQGALACRGDDGDAGPAWSIGWRQTKGCRLAAGGNGILTPGPGSQIALSANEEGAGALEGAAWGGGTESSNPLCSSGESGANSVRTDPRE